MKKIKIFSLAWLITLIWIWSFTSATNFNNCLDNDSCFSCMCDSYWEYCGNDCTESLIMCYDACDTNYIDCEASCWEDEDCIESCYGEMDSCYTTCDNDSLSCSENCVYVPNNCYDEWSDFFTPEDEELVDFWMCYSEYLPWWNEWWNEWWNWVSDWLISQFQGVLLSFWLVISEFIPYVVYIWLWILSVIIWFFAIKWLINRLKNKTLTFFR